MSIRQRSIPATGEEIPIIGLGTWQSFDVDARVAARGPRAVLDEFAACGGRLVDSSPMYGRAEQVVGELATASGLQSRLFIATKVWTTGRDEGVAQMRDSMRKLKVDRVDLMQIHNLLDAETHLPTLREWKERGTIRLIGVTHYTAGAHASVEQFLRRHRVDCLQINYSVAERDAERVLLPQAMDLGIAVIANRPLTANIGRLKGRPLPRMATELECSTWAELLLKFVVSHPAITCAIPATANVDHLRANMRAGSGPMPDEGQREEIARAVNES